MDPSAVQQLLLIGLVQRLELLCGAFQDTQAAIDDPEQQVWLEQTLAGLYRLLAEVPEPLRLAAADRRRDELAS